MTKKMLRCGHVDCILKTGCPHFLEHEWDIDCETKCVKSKDIYRCYDIIEMRKIKLNRLKKDEIGI